MSESIAKWFRNASIAATEEIVEKREQGINDFFDDGYNSG